jgi:hypothetical protein
VYLDQVNSNGTNPFGLKKKKKKTGPRKVNTIEQHQVIYWHYITDKLKIFFTTYYLIVLIDPVELPESH